MNDCLSSVGINELFFFRLVGQDSIPRRDPGQLSEAQHLSNLVRRRIPGRARLGQSEVIYVDIRRLWSHWSVTIASGRCVKVLVWLWGPSL